MREQGHRVVVVASYTLKELLKSKLVWVTLAMAAGIFLLAWVAAEFTFGVPARVALDVGLGALSLAGYGIAIFMGATLISREIDSRTIYMVISRPVSREAFFFGKICGLITFLVMNMAILGVAAVGVAWMMGSHPSTLVGWAFTASLVECTLLMLFVVLLSLGTNTALTVVFSTLILVAGHAVGETRQALYVKLRPLLQGVLEAYHYIFPGFYKFNLKDLVLYQQVPAPGWIFSMLSYGGCYAIFLIALICLIIRKRDFN